MDDFASAAMMQLAQAGLARQGLAFEPAQAGCGPHIPLASKRDGVERILRAHGPLALLRIGEAVIELRDKPLLAAMETASGPHETIDRWRRMETYVHSRHRTAILTSDTQSVTARHVSKLADAPPRRSEDLLIFGVIIALIQLSGARGVRARPIAEEAWAFDAGWRAAPLAEDCSAWRIEWTDVDDDVKTATPRDGAMTLQDLIRSNPLRRWTIGEAAKELGTSSRSLQRQLQADRTTFSRIVAEVRAAYAVRLLDTTDMGIGEIGFVSGYSDQAHFTRSFKLAMAASPGAYRKDDRFRQGGGPERER